MSVPMTLSEVERWDARGQTSLADRRNYVRTVRPRMIEFGMVKQVGEKHISSASATSLSQGRGPQHPQNCWDLLHPPHSMRNNNQILHGDQTRCEDARSDYGS